MGRGRIAKLAWRVGVSLAFCLAAARPVSAQTFPEPAAFLQIKKDLHADLFDALRRAEQLNETLDAGGASASLDALLDAFDRARADDLLIPGIHRQIEEQLVAAGGAVGLHRQVTAAATLRSRLEEIVRLFDEVSSAAGQPVDAARLRGSLGKLIDGLREATASPVDRTPLGQGVTYRSNLNLAAVEPQTGPVVLPAYLDRAQRAPVPADLAAGAEVSLGADIVAEAKTLRHSPIEIFQFVLNEVHAEFYQGAMKGAAATLRERAGNDVDQASLLIALMRASGVPARYVRGIIELSAQQAFAWTGVPTTRRVADLLTRAGIPFRAIRQGGAVASFQIEHTWVEVSVAYANYRGAPLDPRGRSWIPLDPSMKFYRFSPGLDVLQAIGFTTDRLLPVYLSGPQPLSPLDFYKKFISDYLTALRPEARFEDALARWTVQRINPGLLPSTLPYATVAITHESAAIPEEFRHRVRFTARGDDGMSLDVTVPASELVGQRLTLSYVPATVDDQITVDALVGLDNTPAYLVKLRPVLKVGGVVRAAGELPVQMGALHDFTIEIHTPRVSLPVTNSILAGGYYAIGLGSSGFAWQAPKVAAPEDTERPVADLLFGLAADYITKWNEAEQTIGGILGVVPVRPALSEVIVGITYNRTLLFGEPQAIDFRGVFMDADLRITEPVPVGADDNLSVEFMQLSGVAGSMLEGDVLEQKLEVDSVSAVKLLQLARAQGIPIEEINQSNVATALPAIQTDDIVKAHIANLVNQGWVASVPRTDFVRDDWRGIGYMVRDPLTGAGGYFISGGLSGGATATTPEDWVQQQYKDQFQNPYSPPTNQDPLAGFSITRIPITDDQRAAAGQPLPGPIAVLVRDRRGNPVPNASVTFTIQNHSPTSAQFPGGNQIVVQTDALGIARTTLKVGINTAESPVYLKAAPNDKMLTRGSRNTITAKVATTLGDVFLNDPFQRLFTLPGPPAQIKKILGDEARAMVGTSVGTIRVRVEDVHENPVSNVPVDFVVQPASVESPSTGTLPPTAKNMVVYETGTCNNKQPIFDECNGQAQLTGVSTDVFGAAVDAILGNTVGTKFTVKVSAPAVPAVTVVLHSNSSRDYASKAYFLPRLWMSSIQLINDGNKHLSAASVGTRFEHPLGVVLFLLEDNYRLDRVRTSCPKPGPACFEIVPDGTTRVRAIDIHQNGPPITYPQHGSNPAVERPKGSEFAAVQYTPATGGGSLTLGTVKSASQTLPRPPPQSPIPANPGQGQYFDLLTVGPAPMVNQVKISATATVWVPCFDLYTGVVTGELLKLQAGQLHANPMECSSTEPSASGGPISLDYDVFGVEVTLKDPTNAKLRYDGTDAYLATNVTLAYDIKPKEYAAQTLQVDLFEVDSAATVGAEGIPGCTCKWIGAILGSTTSGSGVATLIEGGRVDRTKSHRLQLRLNRGSETEVQSNTVGLAFLSGLVQYDFVPGGENPAVAGKSMLFYGSSHKKPVRGAIVELRDASDNLLDWTETSEQGFYSFDPPTSGALLNIVVQAALSEPGTAPVPRLMVVDKTAGTTYQHKLPVAWIPGVSSATDLHLKSGWNGSAYIPPRDAAPFAILDTIYQAEQKVRSVDANVVFPPLIVDWNVGNAGGAKYDVDLYLDGLADATTDEYDAPVVAHEWSHYLIKFVGRSDNIGGDHTGGDILDPRLAFEEGFGDAFSAMIFDDRRPLYFDTSGFQQGTGLVQHLDNDSILGNDANAKGMLYDGFYSENSIQEVIWDLYDDASSGGFVDDDPVALGFGPLFQAMKAQRQMEPFVTIFSLLKVLKDNVPGQATNIENVAAAENIGLGDEFEATAAPLYTVLKPCPMVADCLTASVSVDHMLPKSLPGRPLFTIDRTWEAPPHPSPYNKLYDWKFFRFEVPQFGRVYEIRVEPTGALTNGDIRFVLNNRGTQQTVDSGVTGAETLTTFLAPGVYTMAVTSNGWTIQFAVTVVGK